MKPYNAAKKYIKAQHPEAIVKIRWDTFYHPEPHKVPIVTVHGLSPHANADAEYLAQIGTRFGAAVQLIEPLAPVKRGRKLPSRDYL